MLLQTEEQALKEKGFRLTRRREAILDVFRSTARHLSAEDVLAELAGRHVKANLTTVYRNVELMARQGLLRPVEFSDGRRRYELSHSDCHHHLHCTRCGKVVEFGGCELGKLEESLQQETGFRIERHQLELHGLCPDCH